MSPMQPASRRPMPPRPSTRCSAPYPTSSVAGKDVRLNGFGIFSTTERAAREGRNPQTGAAIQIAASKAAKFAPAKALKDRLNGAS